MDGVGHLRNTAGIPGILVLVYISSRMFILRMFTGHVARWFSPVGLLAVAFALTSLGLLAFGFATSPGAVYLGVTVYGIGSGHCFPTMLALTSEQFPKGGPFLMGLIGTAGYVSVYLVLPMMGRIYDQQGAEMAFRWVAGGPAVLAVLFAILSLYFKSRGGYQAVQMSQPIPEKLAQSTKAS